MTFIKHILDRLKLRNTKDKEIVSNESVADSEVIVENPENENVKIPKKRMTKYEIERFAVECNAILEKEDKSERYNNN